MEEPRINKNGVLRVSIVELVNIPRLAGEPPPARPSVPEANRRGAFPTAESRSPRRRRIDGVASMEARRGDGVEVDATPAQPRTH